MATYYETKTYYGSYVGPSCEFRAVLQLRHTRGATTFTAYIRRYVQTTGGSFGGTTIKTNWGESDTMDNNGTYADSGWEELGTYAYGKTVSASGKAYYTGGSGTEYSSTATASYTPTTPTYTVTYDANGGNGTMSQSTATAGKAFTTRQNTFTKTGYTFNGWNEAADGSGESWGLTESGVYESGKSWTWSYTNNITLYAQWKENYLTINHYSNYATSTEFDGALNEVGADKNVLVATKYAYFDNPYNEDGLANYTGEDGAVYMKRIGYTGTGYWSTLDGQYLVDENTLFDSGQAVAEAFGLSLETANTSVDIYPQWEINTLTVNYYANQADYCTLEGNEILIDQNAPVATTTYDYSGTEYTDGLADVQNADYLYLSRTGYTKTGEWDTMSDGSGISIEETASFINGQEMAVVFETTLEDSSKVVDVYAQWRENILTVNYLSNYATYARIDGVENKNVNADEKDIVVRTSEYKYTTPIPNGLHDYSNVNDDTYMKRTRYDALGYWGTEPESETEGIFTVHEDAAFESGAELAEALGILSDFESGDVEINLYALWVLLASRVTVYNQDGIPQRGLVHFHTDDMNFVTSDGDTFIDSNGDYFITNNTGVHYAILTVYDQDGNAHMVI